MSFNLYLVAPLILSLTKVCFSTDVNSQSSDAEFAAFLKNRMAYYGNWAIQNELDPSPAIPLEIQLPFASGEWGHLNCSISNQVLTGHSNTSLQTVNAAASFTDHLYSIERKNENENIISGNFTCTGVVLASYDNQLDNNLTFSGRGNFTYRLNFIHENQTLQNFGITQDYKLDFTHSTFNYRWSTSRSVAQLSGEWNDARVSNYLSRIEHEFKYAYLDRIIGIGAAVHENPSRMLLAQYLHDVLTNVTLSDIISGELPPPYDAEPIVTTTARTTTPTTARSTTPTFGTTTSTTARTTTPTFGTITSTTARTTTPTIRTTNKPITGPPSTSSPPPPVGNIFFSCNYCTNYFNFTIVQKLVESIRSKL